MEGIIVVGAMAAVYVGAMVASLFSVRKRNRAVRAVEALPARIQALEAWVAARGWRVADGRHPDLAGQADDILGLAGALPGRDVGAAVTGRIGDKPLLVVESWSSSDDDGGAPTVTAELVTDATLPHTLLEVDRKGRVVYPNRRPENADEVHLDEALRGLPAGARLFMAANRVILHRPGLLAPDLADDILARLTALDQRLPRRPDLSPGR